jgi:N-acetylneuraminic acid mutarotase
MLGTDWGGGIAVTLKDGDVFGLVSWPPLAELYHPKSASWSRAAGVPADYRADFPDIVSLLSDGRVLIAGGCNVLHPTAAVYDSRRNLWSSTAPVITSRCSSVATLLPSSELMVIGGFPSILAGSSGALASLASAEIYNPATNRWRVAARMSTARSSPSATTLRDGRVLVTGGFVGSYSNQMTSAEIYDPLTDRWSPAASMSESNMGNSAVLLADGRVLVMNSPRGEVYDPAANRWSQTGTWSMGVGAAFLRADGTVLVVNPGTRAWIYRPSTNAWSELGTIPLVVHCQVPVGPIALLHDGRVLMGGGLPP